MDTSTLRHILGADPFRVLSSDELSLATASELERAARYIALHLDERDDIVFEYSAHSVDALWTRLGAFWDPLATSFDPSPRTDVAAKLASDDSRVSLALALAKLERNLVAGLLEHQSLALPHEIHVRRLIFNVTTFTRIEDGAFFPLQNVLTQLLSNMISPTSSDSASETIATTCLERYLSGRREDDVVIRLLDSRDPKTNFATLHFVNNLTRSDSRMLLLLSAPGVRWLAQILGRMDDYLDTSDGRFELCTTLFTRLLDLSLQSTLWEKLAVPDEPVTPSQTTLLKLIDSHLVHPAAAPPNHTPSPNAFLVPTWIRLATYARTSMVSGTDDPRLPKVVAALVLACEALSAIGLAAQARQDEASRSRATLIPGGDEEVVSSMKSDHGVVTPLIELLRALNEFLPRIKPRRPEDAPTESTVTPFNNVKRDLVRLLSVLTYDDVAVGDAVRACGGVELVLSLCETDERNAYLREHALFAVRNLMMGNQANQAIIGQMDPLGVVGDNGELLPLPERMKRPRAA